MTGFLKQFDILTQIEILYDMKREFKKNNINGQWDEEIKNVEIKLTELLNT